MLAGVGALRTANRAARSWAAWNATSNRLDVDVQPDPAYEALYGQQMFRLDYEAGEGTA